MGESGFSVSVDLSSLIKCTKPKSNQDPNFDATQCNVTIEPAHGLVRRRPVRVIRRLHHADRRLRRLRAPRPPVPLNLRPKPPVLSPWGHTRAGWALAKTILRGGEGLIHARRLRARQDQANVATTATCPTDARNHGTLRVRFIRRGLMRYVVFDDGWMRYVVFDGRLDEVRCVR